MLDEQPSGHQNRAPSTPLIDAFVRAVRDDKNRPTTNGTADAYRADLALFAVWLRDEMMLWHEHEPLWGSVDHKTVESYLARYGYPETSTAARKVFSVRLFYRWLAGRGFRLRYGDPTAELKSSPANKHVVGAYISRESADKIIKWADARAAFDGHTGARTALVVRLALLHGLAARDLIGLKVGALTYRAMPRLPVLAVGPNREIVLGTETTEAYTTYERFMVRTRRIEPGEPLLRNARGAPITRQGLWDSVRRTATAAGVPLSAAVNVRAMRRTVIVRSVANGLNDDEIENAFGIAAAETTLSYRRAAREYVAAGRRETT